MPRPALREPDVLEATLAGYEADGYDVFVEPSPSVLPQFMRGVRPDAVAIRPDRKIAIEVKRSEGQSSDHIEQLRAMFVGHPDWELRVLYVSPRSPGATIELATPLAIERAISQAQQLKDVEPAGSALLIGWSALEAIARLLLPAQLGRPQPPIRLVEVLATEGLLTPDEADSLREIAKVRNHVAHGELDAEFEPRTVDDLAATVRSLARLIPKAARR